MTGTVPQQAGMGSSHCHALQVERGSDKDCDRDSEGTAAGQWRGRAVAVNTAVVCCSRAAGAPPRPPETCRRAWDIPMLLEC